MIASSEDLIYDLDNFDSLDSILSSLLETITPVQGEGFNVSTGQRISQTGFSNTVDKVNIKKC